MSSLARTSMEVVSKSRIWTSSLKRTRLLPALEVGVLSKPDILTEEANELSLLNLPGVKFPSIHVDVAESAPSLPRQEGEEQRDERCGDMPPLDCDALIRE
eukprot:CAMPEP_0178431984 /NCGR_PEP_ID=MMETSP0689_2-20121128/32144_1 /TAXON_ID=160604 /ORGANISM="Amphidinium massartii, Strain CS-259" /LENGTH=100 /DNA_ID=CAMNT_0020053943 /DNA_START=108 /DNA_END=410 /DNA_ORIENTATION=+